MPDDKRLDAWWSEQTRRASQESFRSEGERQEWLELARLTMESGVTKDQFIAFLEAEAQKRGKTLPPRMASFQHHDKN